MMKALLVATVLVAASGKAMTGPDEAKACRDALSPQGQLMFDATAPHVEPDSKLVDLLRKHVRGLVLSGKLTRGIAQENGQAVGKCLLHLKG